MHESEEYIMNGKKVLVFGMARSGIAAAKLLLLRGNETWVCDGKKLEDFKGALDEVLRMGAQPMLGEAHPEEKLEGFDMLLISPGIPVDHPAVVKAKALGIEVVGEIEYAYREAKGLLLAITGTNGKTTTVTLLGEIFKNAGFTTHVVGNIGVPYSGAVPAMTAADVTVCEISSFMMETSSEFHPHVAAVLNISEDHLNRHGTMECYISLKERIFERCDENDFVVLNWDDEVTRGMAARAKCVPVYFSSREEVPYGAFAKDGRVIFRMDGTDTDVCGTEELYIPGEHNLRNALAACAMAMLCDIPADIVRHTFITFKGVEHRIEFTREVDGVRYINDSKGTNVDSTIQAVRAMKAPTVLILGGYDKHCDFTPLVKVIQENPMIEHIVLIGVTAKQIADTLDKCGYTAYEHCGTDFEYCVRRCRELAQAGGNVLFSPACASFDMFSDYESRGRIFKEIVRKL